MVMKVAASPLARGLRGGVPAQPIAALHDRAACRLPRQRLAEGLGLRHVGAREIGPAAEARVIDPEGRLHTAVRPVMAAAIAAIAAMAAAAMAAAMVDMAAAASSSRLNTHVHSSA